MWYTSTKADFTLSPLKCFKERKCLLIVHQVLKKVFIFKILWVCPIKVEPLNMQGYLYVKTEGLHFNHMLLFELYTS